MDIYERMDARTKELEELGDRQIQLLRELQLEMGKSQEATDVLLAVIRGSE